jgi:hypothetical protein
MTVLYLTNTPHIHKMMVEKGTHKNMTERLLKKLELLPRQIIT